MFAVLLALKSKERNEKQMEINCDQNARGRKEKPSYLWASGIVDELLGRKVRVAHWPP